MGLCLLWNSQKGTRTPGNQDFAGIGRCGDITLVMLADGASLRAQSGALAAALVRRVVDSFVAATGQTGPDDIVHWLRACHAALAPQFPRASASYVIACIDTNGAGFSLHAGDCLLGYVHGRYPVRWLLRPHTLANALEDLDLAALANEAGRHRLTRGFRARAFMTPALTLLEASGDAMLLASDGFWAEIDREGQSQMIAGQHVPPVARADDCSVLCLRPPSEGAECQIHTAGDGIDNLYVAESEAH